MSIIHETDENKLLAAEKLLELVKPAIVAYCGDLAFVAAVDIQNWSNGVGDDFSIHTKLTRNNGFVALNDMCEMNDLDPEVESIFFVCDYNEGEPRMLPLRQWWNECGRDELIGDMGEFEYLVDEDGKEEE